jgi:hypothetical protein
VGFRMQDLMIDVWPGWPGRGFELANERCTCAASAGGGQPEAGMIEPPEDPDDPGDGPVCLETIAPSGDCSPDLDALAADLARLRAELQRGLGQGA